jgi:hypothetical protein
MAVIAPNVKPTIPTIIKDSSNFFIYFSPFSSPYTLSMIAKYDSI